MNYPKNLILLATHGSYNIPFYVKLFLSKKFNERLIKNSSDFATANLIPKDFPKNQKVICNFSRLIGDPNRNLEDENLFREFDFNENRIFRYQLPKVLKRFLIKKYYYNYHKKISNIVNVDEKLIIFDIHDTGNIFMKPNPKDDKLKKEKFPNINLGNLDNKSSSKKVIELLAKELKKELSLEVTLNNPYKGGFVTKKYSKFKNVEVIQIEIGRYLYMDEKTQKINQKEINRIRKGLIKALIKISKSISSS